MPSGFQDFWVVGSRFYYKRDDIGAVVQPLIDLGVIETANPGLTIEKIELEDADGGLKTTVDERVTKIDEVYDITCSNLNMDNQSLLFLAEPPEEFTQAAAQTEYSTTAQFGRLYKIHDGATTPVNIYSLATIAGIINETVDADTTTGTLTDIDVATKTLTVTEDLTTPLSVGDAFIVESDALTNILNSRTYTVVSVTFTSSSAIVVNETPAADEASIAGVVRYQGAADGAVILKPDGVDYTIQTLARGIIRFVPASPNFTVDGPTRFVYSTLALSGKRLINPQEVKGEIQGEGIIIWGRGNNADQSVREARISITPNAANFQVDNFSNMVLSVRVISDLGAVKPAGRLLSFKGDVPAAS